MLQLSWPANACMHSSNHECSFAPNGCQLWSKTQSAAHQDLQGSCMHSFSYCSATVCDCIAAHAAVCPRLSLHRASDTCTSRRRCVLVGSAVLFTAKTLHHHRVQGETYGYLPSRNVACAYYVYMSYQWSGELPCPADLLHHLNFSI